MVPKIKKYLNRATEFVYHHPRSVIVVAGLITTGILAERNIYRNRLVKELYSCMQETGRVEIYIEPGEIEDFTRRTGIGPSGPTEGEFRMDSLSTDMLERALDSCRTGNRSDYMQ